MRNTIKDRKQKHKVLEQRYWRHSLAFNQGRCIYCGDAAKDEDHVPSLDWLYALGSDYFLRKGIHPLKVPSCKRCNGWLGSKPYHSIQQRKAYIAARLRHVSEKFLQSPRWTADEIEEMGQNFRSILNDREAVRLYLDRRIDWAQSTFQWDEV